ncbi:hypothetical protein FKW77_002680 [Venturia effusa]|uniref:Uncharacterized protein n=1 Tax=Venturia effusa TaxID=50376 RepID=A0A517LME9_9PEZI|nr:hypothetical protein FKW77_002680 [Venturia effusa]
MPFGRVKTHDSKDELPESNDELIMIVLNDLGIQDRPDVERRNSYSLETATSARSSSTAVDETSPKWFSVDFSEVSDGWTIAFRNLTEDQLKQAAAAEKQQMKDQIISLKQEVERLRASVLTEREQEREQIQDLKEKLDESQSKASVHDLITVG